jgi:hypothetical protein
MYQEFLSGSGLLHLPLIAMGIFFVTFVLILAWVFLGKRGSKSWNEIASLPLEDDSVTRGEHDPNGGARR